MLDYNDCVPLIVTLYFVCIIDIVVNKVSWPCTSDSYNAFLFWHFILDYILID